MTLNAQWKRQLEAVSQVSQQVTAVLDLNELLVQIGRVIREAFGYYCVSIFLVGPEGKEIVLRECASQDGLGATLKGMRLLAGQGIVGRVVVMNQPYLCNDVTLEPLYMPHQLLPSTRAELAVPIRIGGKVGGVLDVQSRRAGAFNDDDVTVLQVLGDQVANAIQNARLFRSTRQQIDTLRALHDIGLEITSHLESESVVAIILEQAARLLRVQGSVLGVYDAESGVIRVVARHNLPLEITQARLKPGEGVGAEVMATGQPVVVNDLSRWEKRVPAFNEMILPYNAILSVPLRWQGDLFGALSLVDRSERRPFTDEDVQLLGLFADLASMALKKAELYLEITRLSQGLERKVAQRTEELGLARDELAQKAAQLQQLLANMIHIQEEERTRIALDLHDESNQLITAALYEIQAGQESIRGGRYPAALGKLETAKELLRQLETENRRIITGLRPPMLDSQGLLATLKWHVEVFQDHTHIPCRIQVYGHPFRLPSAAVETAVYRIVQESLNNVAAHAQATAVHILVQFSTDALWLIIEDDGIGFNLDRTVRANTNQLGLIGIRERAQSIGGQLEIVSSPSTPATPSTPSIPGKGTRVSLRLPIRQDLTTVENDERYYRTRSR